MPSTDVTLNVPVAASAGLAALLPLSSAASCTVTSPPSASGVKSVIVGVELSSVIVSVAVSVSPSPSVIVYVNTSLTLPGAFALRT